MAMTKFFYQDLPYFILDKQKGDFFALLHSKQNEILNNKHREEVAHEM